MTATSLQLFDRDLPWEDYERLGSFLGQMNRACAWWVGDLVLFGEQIYGEEFSQIEQSLGLAPQTIANRASVARHVPPERRRAALPFGVHAEVAYLEPKERDQWLDRAEREGWTRAKLREEMRALRGDQSDPMGDLAVTSKNQGLDMALGRNTPYGVPAAEGDFLGELVSDPIHTCPNCGHRFLEPDLRSEIQKEGVP